MPKGRDLVAWSMMMTVALLAFAAGVTGSHVLLGLGGIVIGLSGILLARSLTPACAPAGDHDGDSRATSLCMAGEKSKAMLTNATERVRHASNQ